MKIRHFGNIETRSAESTEEYAKTIKKIIEETRKDGYRPATFYEVMAEAIKMETFDGDCDFMLYGNVDIAFCDQFIRNKKGELCVVVIRDASYAETDAFMFKPIDSTLSSLQIHGCEFPFIKV